MMTIKFLRYIFLISILFFGVFFIWFTYPQWITEFLAISNDNKLLSTLGTFGDSFGALNTLFSGLAFTGIIISIFLQSKELRETRKELQEQKDQFVIQSNSMVKQTFETTYFQLLHLHNDITNSITIKEHNNESGESYSGKKAFKEIFNKFDQTDYVEEKVINDKSIKSFLIFYEKYHDDIGHYFRNIYQILKYIKNSDIDNKEFYSNILRAQLSNYESALLFYNCMDDLSKDTFRPLLEEYQFFKHLPAFNIFQEGDVSLYDKNAFGSSHRWKDFFQKSKSNK